MKQRLAASTLRPVAEALEPRLLYSADLGLDTLAGAAGASNQEMSPLPTLVAQTAARSTQAMELVVVDRRIDGVDGLLADLAGQQGAGRPLVVVVIGEGEDGLAKIGQALAAEDSVSAVHVLAHGSAGSMQLGATRLDANALLSQAGAIAAWGDTLTPDADLLLYGCDFAVDDAGRQLMRDLAALTGADVAASDDATGAAVRGGDWVLEASVGTVETGLAPSSAWRSAYVGAMGTPDETSNTLWLGAGNNKHWTDGDTDDGDVLAFQATRLGSDTAGTFEQAFRLSDMGSGAKLDDIVRVSSDLVLPGGVQLRAGDLLFSTDARTTLRSANTLEVEKNDIVLFRPTTAGDYGSGSFTVLISRLGSQAGGPQSNDIRGLALVETDTLVGGTLLRAGTLLFTGDSDAGDRNIWAFSASRLTLGATAEGSSQLLMAGSHLGIGPKVLGIEIVSHPTAIGGTTLAAGTLLVALDSDDSSVGSNTLDTRKGDVIALSLSRSSIGGTAAGIASLLVDGSDLGMDEAVDSLALRTVAMNTPPVIGDGSSSASVDVSEGTTAVQTVNATDPEGRPVSYTIVGGADAARFAIDASTGALRFVQAPDFETPLDGGANNIYDVRVQASDGALSSMQDLRVRVINVNEAPAFRTDGAYAPARTVDEGSLDAGTVQAFDADGATVLTYQLAGGADAALFTVNASTGALRFVTAPDRELPIDANGDNVYELSVRASDGTLSAVMNVAVTVRNVNEAPRITSDGGSATVAVNVAEGTTFSRQIVAVDPDGNTTRFTIVGGADAARFSIDATSGVLALRAVPDHEAPTDSNRDNVYEVRVQAGDGALGSSVQTLRVTVDDVNEAPRITSDGGGATASLAVQAGTSGVTHVAAADTDAGTSLAYVISGGADAVLFQIDAATGALSFVAPAATGPGGADATYAVEVSVTDGTLTDTQALAVRVTATNTAPQFNHGATRSETIDEHTAVVATLAATDAETAALSYTIVGGADAHLFSLDPATGELRFLDAPDVQAPLDADGDNVYEVVVSASDGPLQATQSISVTVAAVNDAPVLSLPSGWTAQEDLPLVLAGITVSDPDAGTAPITLVLSVGHGRLDIDATVTGGVPAAGLAGNGTGSVVLTGSQQQITATLSGAVRYTADPDYAGADTLHATLGDNGGSGARGPLAVQASTAIEVQAVSDAPAWTDAVRDRLGLEDSAIALDLSVAVGDLDNAGGGERLVGVTLSGLPAGARLVNAGGDVLTVRDGSIVLLPSQLVGLRLVPPTDYAGTLELDAAATAQDGSAAVAQSQVRIRVVVQPVADAPTGRDVRLTALEDTTFTFTLAHFGFDDPQDTQGTTGDTLSAVHVASLPTNGSLMLSGQPVAQGERIDVADIVAGRLVYVPPADAAGQGVGRFTFRVEDSGSLANGGQNVDATARQVTLDLASVNDTPVVVSHLLVITEGGSAVPVLQVNDAEQGVEQLAFEVLSAAGGRFELAGAPGEAAASFTLAQVRAGEVRFVQTGGPQAPSYQLQLSDGSASVLTQPVVQFSAATAPGTAPVVGADAPPPASPPVAETAPREAPGSATTPAASTAAPLADPAAGEAPRAPATRFDFEPAVDLGDDRRATHAVNAERELTLSSRTGGDEAAELAFGELAPVESSLLDSLLQNEELARRFEQLREELARQAEGGRTQIATAMAVTSALSAGYVLWVVRGGALLGSVLSALPAWQMVDPLPVLAAGRRKRPDDEADPDPDDEVERLFGERGKATLPKTLAVPAVHRHEPEEAA